MNEWLWLLGFLSLAVTILTAVGFNRLVIKMRERIKKLASDEAVEFKKIQDLISNARHEGAIAAIILILLVIALIIKASD